MTMCYLAKPMLVTKNKDHTFKVCPSRMINKVIVHIADGGSVAGIKGWFEDFEKKIKGKATFGYAGAHFAIGKGGEIWQLVDTKDEAYGAGSSNPTSIQIENVGFSGNSLTDQQIEANANLLNWANSNHHVPLVFNFSMPDGMGPPRIVPLGKGLGYHRQYVNPKDPHGHFLCPGIKIIDQLPDGLARAQSISRGERDVTIEV
jgi:hypothetical protein